MGTHTPNIPRSTFSEIRFTRAEQQPHGEGEQIAEHLAELVIVLDGRDVRRTITATNAVVVFPYHLEDVMRRTGKQVDYWLGPGATAGSYRLFAADGSNELRFMANQVTVSLGLLPVQAQAREITDAAEVYLQRGDQELDALLAVALRLVDSSPLLAMANRVRQRTSPKGRYDALRGTLEAFHDYGTMDEQAVRQAMLACTLLEPYYRVLGLDEIARRAQPAHRRRVLGRIITEIATLEAGERASAIAVVASYTFGPLAEGCDDLRELLHGIARRLPEEYRGQAAAWFRP